MYYTRQELKDAIAVLDRNRAAGEAGAGWCQAARFDESGADAFTAHDGTVVAYGVHGVDYLQVDPGSDGVVCGACHYGDERAIAATKIVVESVKHMGRTVKRMATQPINGKA